MTSATDMAGDITAAGGAVSGLLLVYLGSLSASFGSYAPQERKAVKVSYRRRAWFAFLGLVVFLVSVTAALLGKWFDLSGLIVTAMGLLLVGFCWVVATAVLTVLEIK